MSFKIVVSRFDENISWLTNEGYECVIYNKGTKLNIENEIMSTNVGRESTSYLMYIIDNYDCLPEVVVFTQAKICDHRSEGNDINYLLKMKNDALLLKNKKSLPYITTCNSDKCKNPFLENDFNVWNIIPNTKYKDDKFIIFKDWFEKNINACYPDPMCMYLNGLFAVRKELILNNPLAYYKTLLEEVNYDINPMEGHFMERSWYYIFT